MSGGSKYNGALFLLGVVGALIAAPVPGPASAAAADDKPSISLRAKLIGEQCRLTARVRRAPEGAAAQLQGREPGRWRGVAKKEIDEGFSRWRRPCIGPIGSRVRARLLHKGEAIAKSKAIRQPSAGSSTPPDTTSPSTTIVSGPSGRTNVASPEFTFSADEDPVSFECRLGPEASPGSFGPCSGGGSHSPAAPLGDGGYRFEVRATDAAGNTGEPAARTFTIDATPPSTTIISGPSGTTNDASPEFTFSADEDPVSFECRMGPEAAPGSYGPCSGANGHSPAGPFAEGGYRFEVRATDAAGNTGAATARSFTVETAGCFDDVAAATDGDNPGNLSSNACAQGEGGDAQPSCESGAGRHQWWSVAIPAGETATFKVTTGLANDNGIALFTANSNASELTCRDQFGGGGSTETTVITNVGASPMTVYVQIFALPGHEGPYTLNVNSLNCFDDAPVATEGANPGDLSSNSCPQGEGGRSTLL